MMIMCLVLRYESHGLVATSVCITVDASIMIMSLLLRYESHGLVVINWDPFEATHRDTTGHLKRNRTSLVALALEQLIEFHTRSMAARCIFHGQATI